ncbi:MAG: holin [Lachnospiraceae bacterium]
MNNIVNKIRNNVTNNVWIRAAWVRAVRTMAQAAITAIGTSAVISEVNWGIVISSALLSGILSILMSLAGLPEVDTKTIKEEKQEDKEE